MTQLYRHFDKDGVLLYVGISLSSVARLRQHEDHSHWFEKITRVEIENFETREKAIEAEVNAIICEKPIHNIMHNNKSADEYEKIQADKSRKELTGKMVHFKTFYTFVEVGSLLGIGSKAVQGLVSERKLGAIRLPLRKEGLSHHGTPFKEKRVVSGWQLISYIESLHKESI